MSSITGIPWAEATLNTHYGCTKVSPACKNCYAERMTRRLAANSKTAPLVQDVMAAGKWTGIVNVFPQRMEQVLKWKKPRMIFVNSMSDTFHEQAMDEALYMIFAYMGLAPQHTFLVLTKRAERMADFMSSLTTAGWKRRLQNALPTRELHKAYSNVEQPLKNIWCGVTVETQEQVDNRVPWLMSTPAAARFVSIEPMLGEINLTAVDLGVVGYNNLYINTLTSSTGKAMETMGQVPDWHSLDWVICGTESLAGGRAGRTPDLDAVRDLRNQCVDANIPFFLKQLPNGKGGLVKEPELDGEKWLQYPER